VIIEIINNENLNDSMKVKVSEEKIWNFKEQSMEKIKRMKLGDRGRRKS